MNLMVKSEAMAEGAAPIDRKKLGQIVLVLQGGGALGAYQAGVYQALQEVGIEPDWVIGTSIGAINASLIAGNPPEMRTLKGILGPCATRPVRADAWHRSIPRTVGGQRADD